MEKAINKAELTIKVLRGNLEKGSNIIMLNLKRGLSQNYLRIVFQYGHTQYHVVRR